MMKLPATKRAHIPDLQVCCAVAVYNDNRNQFTGISRKFPYEWLAEIFQCDEKLAYSACERAHNKGLIEYGVSLRTGWLTEKGIELVKQYEHGE